MGSYNLAEVEFDVNTGELHVSSRHKLDVKRQKVIGAVSILLVHADEAQFEDDGRRNSVLRAALHGSLSSILDPQNHPKVTVPSSLSLIDIPHPITLNKDSVQGHSVLENALQKDSIGLRNSSNSDHSQPGQQIGKDEDHTSNLQMGVPLHSHVPAYDLRNKGKPGHQVSKKDEAAYMATDNEFSNRQSDSSSKALNVSVIDLTNMESATSGVDQGIRENRTPRRSDVHSQPHPRKQNTSIIQALHVPPSKKRSSALHQPSSQYSGEQRVKIPLHKVRRNAKISDVLGSGKEHAVEPKCFVCGEKVPSFADNKLHCERHSLPKQCVICGVKLALSSNLNRHVSCHIHNVAFTCPFCPAMYRRKDNLSTHLNQKHNVYPWQRRLLQTKKSFLMSTLSKYGRIGGSHYSNRRSQSSGLRQDMHLSSVHATDSDSVTIDENVTLTTSEPSVDTLTAEQEDNASDGDMMESEVLEAVNNDIILSNTDENEAKSITRQTESVDDHQKDLLPQTLEHMEVPQKEGTDCEGDRDSLEPSDNHGTSNSIINYSCSSCNMRFPLLENLKKHVIHYHSEHVAEEVTETSSSSFTDSDKKISSPSVWIQQSEEHQTSEDTSGNDSTPVMYLEYPQSSEGMYVDDSVYSTTDTSMAEVIDIEKLGELSSSNFTQIPVCKSQEVNPSTSVFSEDPFGTRYTESVSLNQNIHFQNFTCQMSSYSPGRGNSTSGVENAQNLCALPPEQEHSSDNSFIASGRKRKPLSQSRQCMFCQMELETFEQIVEHANEHTDILGKKFVCVTCGTVLSTKDCLRRHAVNHMGVRHSCLFCSTAYSRRDNLLKHMRDAHHYKK